MRYLLDTDTASYIVSPNYQRVHARFAEEHQDDVCISAVTCAEILYGVKKLEISSVKRRDCIAFLKTISIEPWDEFAAECYADIAHFLAKKGAAIGEMDTQIAAHALALKCTLVTNNEKHFGRIAGLTIENWTKK